MFNNILKLIFKKLVKLKIIIISLTLNFNIAYAKHHEFNDLVVFGDSLSDVGNYDMATLHNNLTNLSKMVANDGKIYNEYLSKIFTGKMIYPSNYGGTNYAIANSTILLPDIVPIVSILTMANNYVADIVDEKKSFLNPNNLYIVWGGANDISSHIIDNAMEKIKRTSSINFKNKIYSLFNPQRELEIYNPLKYDDTYYSSNFLKFIAYDLIGHGAKYVIVPNLFDISITPRFNLLTQALPSQIIQIIAFPLSIKMLIDYQSLYQANNIPSETTPGSGNRFIKNNLYTFLNKYGLLGKIAYFFADLASENTQQFNYYLAKKLEEINGNIVYMDIYNLYNEIIDNPNRYGFDDIIMPICAGYQIYAHDPECKTYHQYAIKDKTYLWSDVVHPSDFMHLIIAQYMESVFNAPVLVSSITRHLTSLNSNSEDYINNTLFNLNNNENINKLIPFSSITGSISKIGEPYDYGSKTTNTSSLNVGLTYGLKSNISIGAMLSTSFGSIHPYDNFRYRYNSQIINLFTKYSINDKWWLNSIFDIGRIGADNIRRTINLGKGKHIEKGNTQGTSLGLNITTGYDFQYKNDITLTPYISLNVHNYKVSGFKEENNRSTSMRYANSSTTHKDISIAIRALKKQIL